MKKKTHKKYRKDWRRLAKERAAWYRKVTDTVIPAYQEIKSTVGSMSCNAFYQRLASEGSSATNAGVTITPADYLADVELVLRKILPRQDYKDFAYVVLTDTQKEQIGKELSRRRIFPISVYMTQVRK